MVKWVTNEIKLIGSDSTVRWLSDGRKERILEGQKGDWH